MKRPNIEKIDDNVRARLRTVYLDKVTSENLSLVSDLVEYIKFLEDRLSKRPDWNNDLHEQYLVILNERDNAWGYVDELEERIRDLESDLTHAYTAYQALTQDKPENL